MKKIILWSVVGILIVGIAAGAFWWLSRPQVIQLDKNTKLTLLGVSYGKHHVAPKIKVSGGRVRGNNNARIDTTNDTVVVWIEAEHKPNQYPNYQLMIYDRANTACVSTYSRIQSQIKNGVDIQGFTLDAFPRRGRKIYLRIASYGPRGQQIAKDQFVISNPVRGKNFEKWTPDPLPNTQSDGDLDVTFTKLAAGVPSPYNRGNGIPKNDAVNKGIQIDFDVQQKNQSTTNWHPVQIETSDATGNDVKAWINDSPYSGQQSGYFYQSGLWPDEPAWKMRIEFSRTAGFSDDELWSVTNIPVRAGSEQDAQIFWGNPNSDKTKTAFAETTLNGIHVKLFSAIQYYGNGGGNGKVVSVTFKTDPDPESSGLRLTPLSATDDQGHPLTQQGASWGGGNFQYNFPEPRNTKTINITIALHKSRFVEFTVKPQKAAADNP